MRRKVFVVNTPEGDMDMSLIKRVQEWEKVFVLLSDNSNYQPELSLLDWNRHCVGKILPISETYFHRKLL